MSKIVLIVYGSRFGSTKEIAEKYKQVLEQSDFKVDLVNLKSKKVKIPAIQNYSGLLIGSGIRIARWTKEAKNYLKLNVEQINKIKIPVGVFLSSGEASDPERRQDAIQKYLVKVFHELGLNLDDNVLYDAFGGIYDLSKSTNLNWLNRKMLGTAAKEDTNIDPSGRKDYRDWNQIETFIKKFIAKLQ